MVEKIKDTCIRIRSEMNEWMDCIFIVSEEDAVRAEKVLQEAWDSYWEDGDGWCYGNYLEDKLINAGIDLIHTMQIRRIKYAEQDNSSGRKLFTGKR